MPDEKIAQDIYSLASYQFDLPRELIAQYPVEPRDQCRLLVVNRHTSQLSDHIFTDLPAFINAGDALALNETRVIPARLLGAKASGAAVEILLLSRKDAGWEALVKPARRLAPGSRVIFPDSPVQVEIIEEIDTPGGRLVRFLNCPDEETFIQHMGRMPLPPYINRPADADDNQHYQTVYAQQAGSVAAPTAGLHFTPELLQQLTDQGVDIARLLLHVGLGTFRPVAVEDIRQHQMHAEHYEITAATAQQLNQTRQNGKRVVAVGTTAVRTLETIYRQGYQAGQGETNKFIYPGYRFQAVDGLLTNFHLPGSSLIMLVAALAGIELTRRAYRHAIREGYRFFSYGDAMLII
jgi:S-adenosylmethionine:tRNA ribosyltransferase-isomerase